METVVPARRPGRTARESIVRHDQKRKNERQLNLFDVPLRTSSIGERAMVKCVTNCRSFQLIGMDTPKS